MKYLEKKLDESYTKILCAVLNKSWNHHAIKQQLYSYLPPISQTIQARHAGCCQRSKDKLKVRFSNGPTSVDQPAKSYIHWLYVDTGSCLENLPRVMTAKGGWPERESQRNLGCHHALMILIIIIHYFKYFDS